MQSGCENRVKLPLIATDRCFQNAFTETLNTNDDSGCIIMQTKKATGKNGNEYRKTTPMLPPCRVCGEKASGLHYGVNTCEACKAFFRRSLQRGNSYECHDGNNCDILPGKRSSCSACRFNKCVALGMCKEAIKTGRYTHEKKAEDIKEVKGLIKKESQPSPEQSSDTQSKDSEPTEFIVDDKLEAIIRFITETYMRDTMFTDEFLEKLPQRQKEYLEQKALSNEVFGPLNLISKDEYSHVYHLTGIDVDGRKERIQEEIPHVEMAIKRFISFAKTIPGFNQLCVDDQISLIKASKFEVWMICTHRLFNVEHSLYTEQSGRIVSMDEMKKVNNCAFVDAMFDIEGRIQKLNLSREETCIFAALCVMCTEMCELQDPEVVNTSQNLLRDCLLYMFRKYHSEGQLRFRKFIDCLLKLRTVKELHRQEEESFVSEWLGKLEIPKLVYEIWSS